MLTGTGHKIREKMERKLNILLVLLTFSAIGLSTWGFTSRLNNRNEGLRSIDMLEAGLRMTEEMIRIDVEREKSIAKVLSIANKYNPLMNDSLKLLIAEKVYEMSKVYPNLDIDLICATITHESALSWNPTVVSHAGALGLMQIMPTTGAFLAASHGIKWTTPEEVLFDPIINIQLGCHYLSSLIDIFDVDGGLAAYNGGASQAARWIANNRNSTFLVLETRNYVPAILKLYERFKDKEEIM